MRKHRTQDCDPERNKLAKEKRDKRLNNREAKATATKANANNTGKPKQHEHNKEKLHSVAPENRTYRLGEYAQEHCKWCKEEDVNPHACNHDPATCFRRPGGPLKDVTDPKLRTSKSMELAKQKREDNKKKRTTRRAQRKKKKLGQTSASVAVTPKQTADGDSDPRRKHIPPGRHTAEELANMKPENWSAPSSTFQTRYLKNKTAMRFPITEEEFDVLIPDRKKRMNHKYVDRVRADFHKISGEHKLRAFRKDMYSFLKDGGYNTAYGYILESEMRAIINSTGTAPRLTPAVPTPPPTNDPNYRRKSKHRYKGYQPKLSAKGKAVPQPSAQKRKQDYEPMRRPYTATPPTFTPTTKKSRMETTTDDDELPPIVVEYNHKTGPKLNIQVVERTDGITNPGSPREGITHSATVERSPGSPQYIQDTPMDMPSDEECIPTSYEYRVSDATSTDSDADNEEEVSSSTCCNTHACYSARTNTKITPEQVAEHVTRKPICITRPRRGAILDMIDDILEIPDGLWCPATSKSRPIGTSHMSNHKQKSAINEPLESETKNSRLLQAYVNSR